MHGKAASLLDTNEGTEVQNPRRYMHTLSFRCLYTVYYIPMYTHGLHTWTNACVYGEVYGSLAKTSSE